MIATAESASKMLCPIRSTGVEVVHCAGPGCSLWRWWGGPGVPFPGCEGTLNGKPPATPERPVGGCALAGEPSKHHLRVSGFLQGRAARALGLPEARYSATTNSNETPSSNPTTNDSF